MASQHFQIPFGPITPLSSDFKKDLQQHVKSVTNNVDKAYQLRPQLQRYGSTDSTLSLFSTISTAPSLDYPRPLVRGEITHDFDVPDSSKSPFIDLLQPHQISIMTKNGIFNLYVSHATDHIEQHEASNQTSKISRARVELQLLAAIDQGTFPIEYKLCWNKAVLLSSNFESFWLDKARRLKLPHDCIERYKPNDVLLEYEAPTPPDSESGSPGPFYTNQSLPDSPRAQQLPMPQTDNDEYEDEDDEDTLYINPQAAAYARRLGGEDVSPAVEAGPSNDPRAAIGVDTAGLARETGDDGAWGHPKKPSNSKSKTTKPKPKTSRSRSTSTSSTRLTASRTTPAKARAVKTPTPKKVHFAKPKTTGTKRGFAAIADEVGGVDGNGNGNGSPAKRSKKGEKGVGEGGKGMGKGKGRQRKLTEKAREVVAGLA